MRAAEATQERAPGKHIVQPQQATSAGPALSFKERLQWRRVQTGQGDIGSDTRNEQKKEREEDFIP